MLVSFSLVLDINGKYDVGLVFENFDILKYLISIELINYFNIEMN